MKKVFNKIWKNSLFLTIGFLVSEQSLAGAWTQPQGEGIFIGRAEWYVSTRSYDKEGDLFVSPRHRELKINPYVEYGITDNFTIGTNIFYLDITNTPGKGASDFGDIEVFGRYRLWEKEYSVLSVQGLFKYPGPASGFAVPNNGDRQVDIEGNILFGTGGRLSTVHDDFWFLDTRLGYRKRFNGPADEIRADALAGFKMNEQKTWWMVKSENIIGMHNPSPNGNPPNYDLYTIEPSVLYWIRPIVGLQAGIRYDYFGRNVGVGTAPFVAVWVNFN